MPGEADWLRKRLEELERIERPSASDGERQAAEWLVAQFAELGAEARNDNGSAAIDYTTLEQAINLSQEATRRLSRRWL